MSERRGSSPDVLKQNREKAVETIKQIPGNVKAIPGKVIKKGTDFIKDKAVDAASGVVNKATAGIKGAISSAGKAASSTVGKSILGGAAILGTAALAAKALERRKENKEKEKLKPVGMKEQMSFQQFQEKCWAGYEKKGMKTMFGKRYPNCVKKKK